MWSSKEYRKWISMVRKRHGKRNGVISSGCLDSPTFEIKDWKSKKRYNRKYKDG